MDICAGTLATPTSTLPGTSTASHTTSANKPTQSAGSSSTNTGAIAGGVVGGIVGAAALGALLFFLIRRRKRQPKEPSESQASNPAFSAYPHEKEATQPGELGEGRVLVELSESNHAKHHELPAAN